jgi:hypothetical protein
LLTERYSNVLWVSCNTADSVPIEEMYCEILATLRTMLQREIVLWVSCNTLDNVAKRDCTVSFWQHCGNLAERYCTVFSCNIVDNVAIEL